MKKLKKVLSKANNSLGEIEILRTFYSCNRRDDKLPTFIYKNGKEFFSDDYTCFLEDIVIKELTKINRSLSEAIKLRDFIISQGFQKIDNEYYCFNEKYREPYVKVNNYIEKCIKKYF